jgi:aarF domain-containing kinase
METGRPLDDMFSEFDETPIGVASLAQVHTATERLTGRRVAVKIQVRLVHLLTHRS